jgi:hypothetical protein
MVPHTAVGLTWNRNFSCREGSDCLKAPVVQRTVPFTREHTNSLNFGWGRLGAGLEERKLRVAGNSSVKTTCVAFPGPTWVRVMVYSIVCPATTVAGPVLVITKSTTPQASVTAGRAKTPMAISARAKILFLAVIIGGRVIVSVVGLRPGQPHPPGWTSCP